MYVRMYVCYGLCMYVCVCLSILGTEYKPTTCEQTTNHKSQTCRPADRRPQNAEARTIDALAEGESGLAGRASVTWVQDV